MYIILINQTLEQNNTRRDGSARMQTQSMRQIVLTPKISHVQSTQALDPALKR